MISVTETTYYTGVIDMMNESKAFRRDMIKIALPVTLQCLLQSSFSVVDQIMTGQLGSVSIAGIGLGSKFASFFSVLLSAVAAVAGIMIAQYIGKNDLREVGRSFYTSLSVSLALVVLFTGLCEIFPVQIMHLYTDDQAAACMAAGYLRIYAAGFLPTTLGTLLSVYLRCVNAAAIPLYASIGSAVINTGLNYVLIFGKLGVPALGVEGAALASVIAQLMGCLVILVLFLVRVRKKNARLPFVLSIRGEIMRRYAAILMPILVCEFFWSLGENVYASIYGHIGTAPLAAMTLTNPIQALMIGALSGVSQAAGILIGKSLGAGEREKAYRDSKRLMLYGLAGSILLSVALMRFSHSYVQIFRVEDSVRLTAQKLLFVFALIGPVKVQNMILGGGIIRSGGKTKYVMVIDLIGTWIFGVPLGLLAAFVWNLPVAAVYLILSLEEGVRLIISLVVFRGKRWMRSL